MLASHSFSISRRFFLRVLLIAASLALLAGLPATTLAAPDPELASFGARADGTLSPDFVTSKAGIPLTTGTPMVFHSNGSQASLYPAGFTTVAGPFDASDPFFDSVVIVLSAHNSAPASATLDFEVRNGTTGEVITGFSGVTVDNIPLDDVSPGAPPEDHCQDPFNTSGTIFQITLAPPVNEVFVGPDDDLQLIITPTAIFGGAVEICVDNKGFYTTLGVVVEPVPVPNQPPVAVLSLPDFVEATSPAGAMVTLDASASSDPDGDPLTFVFSGPFGVIDNGANPVLDVLLPFSPPSLASAVSVTVTDDDDASDSANASVTVQDTTPPTLTVPAEVVASADSSCQAAPSLGVATASDAASPPLLIENDAPPIFLLGETVVTWTATDTSGNSSTAEQKVTVVDDTSPVLTVMVTPDTLTPPNHKLVLVEASISALDNCDADPAITLVSIVSNEPDEGLGDGDTANDIQIVESGPTAFRFNLRAERSGLGDGRVYTITFEAMDASGNTTTATATVTVPKSRAR